MSRGLCCLQPLWLAFCMRKSKAADVAARNAEEIAREQAGVQLVCLALALSLVVLGWRIFSVW
jgi:hypothetical protein